MPRKAIDMRRLSETAREIPEKFCYQLDPRYGRPRQVDFGVYRDLIRTLYIDNMIEEQGIKPGDEIEILTFSRGWGSLHQELEWRKPPVPGATFYEVENCRLRFQYPDPLRVGGTKTSGMELGTVLAIRKVRNIGAG